MMIELTYTEAKELINTIGRFTITNNQYYGLTVLEAENGAEYAIGTDDECDEAWNDCLDNYIEECVLYEIPEAYKFYFDDEKFKDDCRHDGRAHSLASYDGNEELIGDCYMYRIN